MKLKFVAKLGILLVAAVVLVARLTYYYLSDPHSFPVNVVKVSAAYQQVSRKEIEEVLQHYVNDSYFSLSIKNMRDDLMKINWVQEASISRHWPDSITITVIEKKPVAKWNEKYITAVGEVLPIDDTNHNIDVPMLNGVEKNKAEVLQIYKKLSKIAENCDVRILSLTQNDNEALEIVLTNNVQIRLGKHNLLKRMQRFCKAYKATLASKFDQVNNVDMRYASGMAVEWK